MTLKLESVGMGIPRRWRDRRSNGIEMDDGWVAAGNKVVGVRKGLQLECGRTSRRDYGRFAVVI